MKTKFRCLGASLSIPFGLLLGSALLAADTLQVELKDFASYRDFTVAGQTREATAEVFAARLREFWERQGTEKWPEGRTLEVTFRDIDLAGEIEPWRDPLNPDLRVVDRRTPPYLRFSYTVRSADGEVVTDGDETLFDRRFLFGRLERSWDELVFPHEFDLFHRWVVERLVPSLDEDGEPAS